MEERKKEKDEKSEKKRHYIRNTLIIIGIILLLLLLIRCGSSGTPKTGGTGNVTFGVIDPGNGTPKYDVQELVNSIVAESEFQVFINTDIQVSSTNDANVKIQNIKQNHHSCFVEIVDNSADVVLYESDNIPPGYKVEHSVLDESLSSGVHDCTAFFHVIDDDGIEINKIGVAVSMSKKA